MSRRRARVEETTTWEADTPTWWDQPMPEPWEGYLWSEWQEAWAETTLSVCERVWRKQGARIYFRPADRWLRDDLHDWLILQAQGLANEYLPDPTYDDPSRKWGAWLWSCLNDHARRHFREMVGTSEEKIVATSRRGVASVDHLAELEAAEGYRPILHALHGSYGHEDPLSVLIRQENFTHDLAEALKLRRQRGTWSTESSLFCREPGCSRANQIRGYCTKHYERHRSHWGVREDTPVCAEEECPRLSVTRGYCQTHYHQHLRAGDLPPREFAKGTCSTDGCSRAVRYNGVCRQHANRSPCTIDGCDRAQEARGLCKKHYELQRLNRNAS